MSIYESKKALLEKLQSELSGDIKDLHVDECKQIA